MNNIFDKLLDYWNNEEIQDKFKKRFLRPILLYICWYVILLSLFIYIMLKSINKIFCSNIEK